MGYQPNTIAPDIADMPMLGDYVRLLHPGSGWQPLSSDAFLLQFTVDLPSHLREHLEDRCEFLIDQGQVDRATKIIELLDGIDARFEDLEEDQEDFSKSEDDSPADDLTRVRWSDFLMLERDPNSAWGAPQRSHG